MLFSARENQFLCGAIFKGFLNQSHRILHELKKIRNFSVLVQNSRCNLLLTTWRQKVISLIFVFFFFYFSFSP